jgi:hypothetical protein
VIEDHRAVAATDVGQLVLAETGDGKTCLLVKDTGQILRRSRARISTAASRRPMRAPEGRTALRAVFWF